MTIGKRIREKRKAAKLTQGQVADYFGISSVSVSEWERDLGKPEPDKLVPLARLLKTTVTYLLAGTGDTLSVEQTPADYNVETAAINGRLPRISWVQAGEWAEIVDNFQPGDAEDWIPCPFKHGKGAFVLDIVGLSMYNPGGDKSYAPGESIAVDPNIEPQHMSMVVAKIDGEERATFKQLLIDGEGNYALKALNPSHTPRVMSMPPDSRIVGVVIGKWTPE